jgi:hypothetical protein
MRAWSIELWLLDDQGQQIPANIFEKVMYELHPTFAKPKQSTFLYPSQTRTELLSAYLRSFSSSTANQSEQ